MEKDGKREARPLALEALPFWLPARRRVSSSSESASSSMRALVLLLLSWVSPLR